MCLCVFPLEIYAVLTAQCEYVSSDFCGQGRPILACTSAQSDQKSKPPDEGLLCLLTDLLDTIRCMNGEQMSSSI